MVRDGAEFIIGPRFARTRWHLLTMRVCKLVAPDTLILRSPPQAGVSKDGRKEIARRLFSHNAISSHDNGHRSTHRPSRYHQRVTDGE
jgi:hypothetical protein